MSRYLGSSIPVFIGVTVVVFGGASWLTGRALAVTWKSLWLALPYGILLGLGIDVPLGSDNPKLEASSLFFDVSYNTFSLANFSASPEEARFISASLGYSLLLPERKSGK